MKDISLCSICKIRNADKKGSHLVPISLVAGIINYDNSLKRGGKELTFLIGTSVRTDVFVGRSVPPEEIKRYISHEKIDEKLSQNSDPLVRDYILCSVCESSLGDLEALFHSKVISNLLVKDVNVESVEYQIKELPIPSTLLKAYFLSIAYRASIGKVSGFFLPNRFMSSLQKMFMELFKVGVKNWSEVQHKIVINHFNGSFYCVCNQKITSKNIILFNPNISNPFQICLGNFFITFSESSKTKIDFKKYTHFNLWRVLDPKAVMELNEDLLKIILVNNERWDEHLMSTQKFLSAHFFLSLRLMISHYFVKLLKRKPYSNEQLYLLDKIINSEEISIIERYDSKRIERILWDFFKG
jgi:hypothetical protein